MNLPSITGTAHITLEGARILPPGPPHTYLGVARAFVAGAQVLAAAATSNAISLAFLCAQAAECALKAYLSRSGSDAKLKAPNIRHNLVELWTLASDEGLAIAADPPAWLTLLDQLHAAPYRLRYSTGVNGLATPASQPMVVELAALIELVAKQL